MQEAPLGKYSQVFLSSQLGSKASLAYSERRKRLLENLSSLCLFSGVERSPGTEHVWAYHADRRIQDPAVLFLTGINQAGVFLALDPLATDPADREILFLPERDPSREFWDGTMLGLVRGAGEPASLAEMQALTGFTQIKPARVFWVWLRNRLPKIRRNHIFAFWHDYTDPISQTHLSNKTDHNWQFQLKVSSLLKRVCPMAELRSVASLHMHLRIPLDRARIQMVRVAEAATLQAFASVLRNLATLSNEREVQALIDSEMRRQSDDGLAFPTIVACGDNACTLHYSKCDEPLQAGRLLLLDFGVRVGSLCSDVSRTIPVGGVFNPLQRLLYQIVLDTQAFHQGNIRPGLTIRELNVIAWNHLEDLLRTRFLAKGGQMRRQYPRLPSNPEDPRRPTSLGPHGISHLIGEQVHEGDPFRIYQDQPLRPGMLISNEPGLYGQFVAVFNGVRYEETIGIRIEDDLLVTARGCQNLSQGIPKDPDELEALLNP